MELRKAWFPILLATIWMVLAASALTDFAGFAAATARPAVVTQKAPPARRVAAGRRPAGRSVSVREAAVR